MPNYFKSPLSVSNLQDISLASELLRLSQSMHHQNYCDRTYVNEAGSRQIDNVGPVSNSAEQENTEEILAENVASADNSMQADVARQETSGAKRKTHPARSSSSKRMKAKVVPKKPHRGKVGSEYIQKSSERSKTKMSRSKTVYNKVN
jgi:hypothetical protein